MSTAIYKENRLFHLPQLMQYTLKILPWILSSSSDCSRKHILCIGMIIAHKNTKMCLLTESFTSSFSLSLSSGLETVRLKINHDLEKTKMPFSSPEAALLLVSTKNRDLWACPTPEVRDSRTSRNSAHVQSQVWQIWLVLVSIYCVYKAIQNQNVVGLGQRSRCLVLTKRSMASGNENAKMLARQDLLVKMTSRLAA